MTRLTPTMTAILVHAAARKDGAVEPLPEDLAVSDRTLRTTLLKLMHAGLIEATPSGDTASSAEGDLGAERALLVTQAGREAVRAVKTTQPPKSGSGGKARRREAGTNDNRADAPRPGTKQALLVTRLSEGATIADLMAATAWQAHTVRAALTDLRKRGYEIVSEPAEGGTRIYRLGNPGRSGK